MNPLLLSFPMNPLLLLPYLTYLYYLFIFAALIMILTRKDFAEIIYYLFVANMHPNQQSISQFSQVMCHLKGCSWLAIQFQNP